MAISDDELEQYIFDPKNPKACYVYKLLLNIAKKDYATYISKDFFSELFIADIGSIIQKDLYLSVPKDFNNLPIHEKVNLYIKQYSKLDFLDLLDENKELLKFDQYADLFKKLFFFDFKEVKERKSALLALTSPLEYDIKDALVISKIDNISEDYREYFSSYNRYKKYEIEQFNGYESRNKIIFYNFEDFNIFDLDFFNRVTVLVTSLDNLHNFNRQINFGSNSSKNIKPIFLKNIQDVHILLNALKNDLLKEKNIEVKQQDITAIDKISISNFYSIQNLEIDNLKDKREVYIVGENGDGKTLLLQSIVAGLAGVKKGEIFDLVNSQEDAKIEIIDSNNNKYTKEQGNYKNIFAYGSSRYNNCQTKEDKLGYLTLFNNIYDLKSPIKWLLELDYNERADKENIISAKEAKELLIEHLNRDVEIKITPPNSVTFIEKGAEVAFNQLSAGYQGVITIICDLIERLSKAQPFVTDIKEFKGVVLIDEVELHLHPKWKYNFMQKLRETFPNIQFIVTTHSPTVILGASKDAVFYKVYKEEGKINISNQIANEGYTSNSLISSPLFDLENIASRNYDKPVNSDDYIYSKIHQVINKKLKEDMNINEDELLKTINEELDKL